MNTSLTSPDRTEILSCLSDLISVASDGAEGFTQAAEHATNAGLKQTFREKALERAAMVTELQHLERQHGREQTDDSGSLTGTLHRAWINIRTAVASSNDQVILEEAERGEDAAVAEYKKALHKVTPPLPRSITSVLEPQFAKVKQSHDQIRDLRDSGRFTPGEA